MSTLETDSFKTGRQLAYVSRQLADIEEALGSKFRVDDFDVADRRLAGSGLFRNREEVKDEFIEMLSGLDPNNPTENYFIAKITSHIAVLNALGGVRLPFSRYLRATMGITPQRVPKWEIEEGYNHIKRQFKDLGYEWSEDGYKKFQNEHRLTPEEITSSFNDAERRILPIILKAAGEPNLQIPYKVIAVYEDSPWVSWTSGNRDKFLLEVNTHERNADRLVEGLPGMNFVHEIGNHMAMAESWRKNINNRKINVGYGITSVPGPEQWGLEGMAVTSPLYINDLDEVLTPYEKFAFALRQFSFLVRKNAHFDMNDSAIPFEKVFQTVKKYLPSEADDRLKRDLHLMANDPVYRSYFMSYEDGTHFLTKIAGSLSKEQKTQVFRSFFEHPRTADQIKEVVADIVKISSSSLGHTTAAS